MLYGVDTRAAKEIDELTERDRRRRAPRPLRQRPDLPGGRPENPVAEAEPAGDLREAPHDPDLDALSRRAADGRGRHRPLHRREFRAALSWPTKGWSTALSDAIIELDRLPRGAAGPPTSPAPSRRSAPRGDRACRRHAGDRRHHRRRGRGGERRRRRTRRHDADVRLDHLHHHADARSGCATHASGMRRGCSRASTPRWRGSRRAARSPTGSATSSPASSTPETAFADACRRSRASPPGANGLVLLPYFSGERTPIHDPNAKGVIFGLDLTHTRGDIYRAVFEGIACGTSHVFETYREIGLPPKAVFAVGGGTKNAVWAQATSDISGLDADCARKDRRRLLWRRLPRRAGGRRRRRSATSPHGTRSRRTISRPTPLEPRSTTPVSHLPRALSANQGPDAPMTTTVSAGDLCEARRRVMRAASTTRRSTAPAR